MDNPLKKYFRRPALYFKLPSMGKLYAADVLDMPPNNELPVFPMTAIDEITVRSPDALYNGAAMVDLIRSCVPNIKDPWKINSVDFDAVLIAIRAATVGNTLDIESKCPSCSESGTYGINLVQLLAKQVDVNYEEPLRVRELEIKFRPLTFTEINKNQLDQFEIQSAIANLENYENTPEQQKQMADTMSKMNRMVMHTISSTIEWIRTPESTVYEREFIMEFMESCDKQTSDAIRDRSIKLKETNEIPPINLKCMNCQHEYPQKVILNSSDFFA